MKKVFKLLASAFLFICITTIYSCNKDDAEIPPQRGADKIPTLMTADVSFISETSIVTGGVITSTGGFDVTARGVCYGVSPYPSVYGIKTTDGTGQGAFLSNIAGLTSNATYYVMAYATNTAGTAYGEVLSFTTPLNKKLFFNPDLSYRSVSDIDGNVYKTIQIGTQEWLAENLKTTKYNDGTPIPNVTDDTKWKYLNSGAYCWYNNDSSSFKAIYGALYNWYAVDQGKLCPSGWHVPSHEEWRTLKTYLGDNEHTGGKLKETGTIHWLAPNISASNESGFTAVPGGLRVDVFTEVNIMSSYWSTDIVVVQDDWGDFVTPGASAIGNTSGILAVIGNPTGDNPGSDFYGGTGKSVRCIKDN